MPYIPQEDRERASVAPENVGELTYCYYKIAIEYIARKGRRFTTFAEIMGALTATSHELYLRHVGPYEATRRETEGDVTWTIPS